MFIPLAKESTWSKDGHLGSSWLLSSMVSSSRSKDLDIIRLCPGLWGAGIGPPSVSSLPCLDAWFGESRLNLKI